MADGSSFFRRRCLKSLLPSRGRREIWISSRGFILVKTTREGAKSFSSLGVEQSDLVLPSFDGKLMLEAIYSLMRRVVLGERATGYFKWSETASSERASCKVLVRILAGRLSDPLRTVTFNLWMRISYFPSDQKCLE